MASSCLGCYDAIDVQNGLFTLYLIPSSGSLNEAFNGQPRWLEIRVRPTGTISFTSLGRQAISPAPYAWSLYPRALISGSTSLSGFGNAILNVDNTRPLSGGDASSGLFVRASTGSAVRGESGGVGVLGTSTWTYAVQGQAITGTAGYFTSGEGYGVFGSSSGDDHWDHGGYFTATMGYGVYGVSAHNYGVRGEGYYGVRGDGTSTGVHGFSATGSGVLGTSDSGYGVHGSSANGFGVMGTSESGSGVYGVGAYDYGYGVQGEGRYGVRGEGYYGVYGDGTSAGVMGVTEADDGCAVRGRDKSSAGGWAGFFTSDNGNGVYVSVGAGAVGLMVTGSKSAVVPTDDGSRLLSAEESTEIWFTDYGFGTLAGGTAAVTIDPLFAQTVNLEEPYHVFLQAYGDAALYVTDRTPTSFEVRAHEGDPDVEFSYRLVAKRLGYEDDRLEPAPWADDDPNLYPERAQSASLQQGGRP